MMLNVSVDGGSTWTGYAPELIDFEQYPATLLRFVDIDNAEYTPLDEPTDNS